MPPHRFHAGQIVETRPDRLGIIPPGRFEIVRELPPTVAGVNQYRVKSVQTAQERVLTESDFNVPA